jgi:hypothetical protein
VDGRLGLLKTNLRLPYPEKPFQHVLGSRRARVRSDHPVASESGVLEFHGQSLLVCDARNRQKCETEQPQSENGYSTS